MSSYYNSSQYHNSSSWADREQVAGFGRTLSGGIQVAGFEDELPFSLPVARQQSNQGSVGGNHSSNKPSPRKKKEPAPDFGESVIPLTPLREGEDSESGEDDDSDSNNRFFVSKHPKTQRQPQRKPQRKPQQNESIAVGASVNAQGSIGTGLNRGTSASTKRIAAMEQNFQKDRSEYSASSSSSEEEGEVDEIVSALPGRNDSLKTVGKVRAPGKVALTRSFGSQASVRRKVANFNDPRNLKSLAVNSRPKRVPPQRAPSQVRDPGQEKVRARDLKKGAMGAVYPSKKCEVAFSSNKTAVSPRSKGNDNPSKGNDRVV